MFQKNYDIIIDSLDQIDVDFDMFSQQEPEPESLLCPHCQQYGDFGPIFPYLLDTNDTKDVKVSGMFIRFDEHLIGNLIQLAKNAQEERDDSRQIVLATDAAFHCAEHFFVTDSWFDGNNHDGYRFNIHRSFDERNKVIQVDGTAVQLLVDITRSDDSQGEIKTYKSMRYQIADLYAILEFMNLHARSHLRQMQTSEVDEEFDEDTI
jgi:hypothetical protein